MHFIRIIVTEKKFVSFFLYAVGIGQKFCFCFVFTKDCPNFKKYLSLGIPAHNFENPNFFTKILFVKIKTDFSIESKYTKKSSALWKKNVSIYINKQQIFWRKLIILFKLDKIGSALNELNWSIIRFSPAPLKTFSRQKNMKGTMLWKLSGREDFFTCFFAKDFLQLIFMSTSSVVTSGGLHDVAKSFLKSPHLNSVISREFV